MPGLRPEARRNDFGAGLASPPLLGGFQEFLEFLPSRVSNSATRLTNAAINASRQASNTSSCSTEGTGGTVDTDNGSTTRSTYLRRKSQNGQAKPPAAQIKINKPRRRGPE